MQPHNLSQQYKMQEMQRLLIPIDAHDDSMDLNRELKPHRRVREM